MFEDKNILSKTEFGYVLKMPCASNIICGFSTRAFNYDFRAASPFSTSEDIRHNRLRFFENLNLNLNNSVFIEQVHGAWIKEVIQTDKGKGAGEYKSSIPDADAMITSLKDTPICMLSADCLPLLFWHPEKNIIGVAHAGWKGLEAGIAFKTAQRIKETFKCSLENIKVFIGPGIRVCCYEVSEEFKQHFPGFVFESKGRFYLDMIKAAFSQLLEAGIAGENIIDSELCTKCHNTEVFSFRGGDKQKRILSFIALK